MASASRCPHCGAPHAFIATTVPRFGERVRRLGEFVIIPSLLALAAACFVFLLTLLHGAGSDEPSIPLGAIEALLAAGVALTTSVAVAFSTALEKRETAYRCTRCGALVGV